MYTYFKVFSHYSLINSCCVAQEAKLDSCSDPGSGRATQKDFGPRPPLVSVATSLEATPTGRLDSDNAYVSEHLLQLIDDKDQFSFFQRYQAGFVVTDRREPALSVCGCSDPLDTCTALNTTRALDSTETCPHLVSCEECIEEGLFNDTLPDPDSCPATLPGCYTVDRASVSTTQNLTCHASSHAACGTPEQMPVGAVFPDQTGQAAVTVWYNNQVMD